MLPASWLECSRDHADIQAASGEPVDSVGSSEFNSVWIVGSKNGAVHSGLEASGVGSLRLVAAQLRSLSTFVFLLAVAGL